MTPTTGGEGAGGRGGERGGQWGLRGGVAGSIVGGLTWVVVAGIVLDTPFLWITAIALAVGLWRATVTAAERYPRRLLTVFGVALLCLVAADGLYLRLVYPRLPEVPASRWFDLSQSSLNPVRPILWAAAAGGVALILWDLGRRRRRNG